MRLWPTWTLPVCCLCLGFTVTADEDGEYQNAVDDLLDVMCAETAENEIILGGRLQG
jgi:hypothetical protein